MGHPEIQCRSTALSQTPSSFASRLRSKVGGKFKMFQLGAYTSPAPLFQLGDVSVEIGLDVVNSSMAISTGGGVSKNAGAASSSWQPYVPGQAGAVCVESSRDSEPVFEDCL